MVTRKIYCFVDETGQDTLGKIFLVAVVIKDAGVLEKLGEQIEKLEKVSGKNLLKWTRADFNKKIDFLKLLLSVDGLKNAIYYSVFENSRAYSPLISLTVAKTIYAQKVENYQANIIIDGLNEAEAVKVKKELKKLNVHYKNVRGMKDEQNVFLRLADTFAGFLRDCLENKEYTKQLNKKFIEAQIVEEI